MEGLRGFPSSSSLVPPPPLSSPGLFPTTGFNARLEPSILLQHNIFLLGTVLLSGGGPVPSNIFEKRLLFLGGPEVVTGVVVLEQQVESNRQEESNNGNKLCALFPPNVDYNTSQTVGFLFGL